MDAGYWPQTEAELEGIQRDLAARAVQVVPWHPPADRSTVVAGLFVAYRSGQVGMGNCGDPAWAAAAALRDRQLLASALVKGAVGAPYIPGYLALREGRLLEETMRALPCTPDVVLVNATGKDHPRGAGLALHLGAVLDLPTIGVTDRPLLAAGLEPGPHRGAAAPLVLGGEVVGFRLRTRRGVRPVVVHSGWRTGPETACAIVLTVSRRSRTPEPIRQARRLGRTFRTHEPWPWLPDAKNSLAP